MEALLLLRFFSFTRRALYISNSWMRVSKLSVSLHNCFTAPTFSIKTCSYCCKKNRNESCWTNMGGLIEKGIYAASATYFVHHEKVVNFLSVWACDVPYLSHRFRKQLPHILGYDAWPKKERKWLKQSSDNCVHWATSSWCTPSCVYLCVSLLTPGHALYKMLHLLWKDVMQEWIHCVVCAIWFTPQFDQLLKRLINTIYLWHGPLLL